MDDPGKRQNTFESTLLIQLLQSLSSNMETLKGLQQSSNSTLALIVEHMIHLRQEISERESETLVTRAWRTEMEIKSLEAKDSEYAAEMKKVHEAQEGVKAQLESIRSGRGQTQEKIKTAIEDAMSKDKIDIRGIKIPSRLLPYILLAIIALIVLLTILMPDAVAQILYNVSAWIGGSPPK